MIKQDNNMSKGEHDYWEGKCDEVSTSPEAPGSATDFIDWADTKTDEILLKYRNCGTDIKGGLPFFKALKEAYELGRQSK